MCCCERPNVNGQPGYRWQPNDAPRIRPPSPPALNEYEHVLFDLPGRCGGIDSHCHHFIITSSHDLLVKHGGGEERIRISNSKSVIGALQAASSIGLAEHNAYWIAHAIYQAYSSGRVYGADRERGTWSQAAVEKRIKVRRRKNSVRVEIIPAK